MGEIPIGREMVVRLVGAQMPGWAGLPVVRVRSAGTDHAMFRLGDDMVVRLPRIPHAVRQVAKEQRWLPRLAPHLPLDVPAPLAEGVPADGYPFPWSVYRWLPGDNAFDAPLTDLHDTAVRLGRFLHALQRIDTAGGPPSFRGGPVSAHDDAVRAALRDLAATGDPDTARRATEAWNQILTLPPWPGPPVWTHSDLLPTNLLARSGRLTAIIDFGGLGTGDPACDALPAWTTLSPETRDTFRTTAGFDDPTWARGRGWALAWGLMTDHHHRTTNPTLATIARQTRSAALAAP
ncbi:aminoglycoside phosphotransferase family protein [Actinocorallia lasiicapitis]